MEILVDVNSKKLIDTLYSRMSNLTFERLGSTGQDSMVTIESIQFTYKGVQFKLSKEQNTLATLFNSHGNPITYKLIFDKDGKSYQAYPFRSLEGKPAQTYTNDDLQKKILEIWKHGNLSSEQDISDVLGDDFFE